MNSKRPIAWDTARAVATMIARKEPYSQSYLAASLGDDFARVTAHAEKLIEPESGLVANGTAESIVVSRPEWSAANLAMFRRMLSPMLERMNERSIGAHGAVASQVAGLQIGSILGWMSTRVLGQYDMLYDPNRTDEKQDVVYYVGPNILALEKRYAFPPEQFRLWIALHECTHRAQFTGVPWLPGYFRDLVNEMLTTVDIEGEQFSETAKRIRETLRDQRSEIKKIGIVAALGNSQQLAMLPKIMGLMSLLEGHGEVVMARAGKDFVPEAKRFHRVMKDRRKNANPIAKFLQHILGIEVKLKQYAQGESFIEAVEEQKGVAFFRQVWTKPENLPTMDEIRTPSTWIARMESHVVDIP